MYFCYCTHGCVCQLVIKENADDDDDDDDDCKAIFGRKFSKSENAYVLAQFFGPHGKTPGRISVKLTDNSFPVRSFVLPYLAPKYFRPFQRLRIK